MAAPVVTCSTPPLMSGAMIWLGTAYPALMLATEWRAAVRHGLGWALVGRMPGTATGILVVSLVSARLLGALVGVVVVMMMAVVLTGLVVRLPTRPWVFVGAGVGVRGDWDGHPDRRTSAAASPLEPVLREASGQS